MALGDYLFESALPSFAKQFISFQALAERHPGQVRLVPYERLMAVLVQVLAGILDHLSGAPRERPALADASTLMICGNSAAAVSVVLVSVVVVIEQTLLR